MNIESIAEVKVLTPGYQAEYGRSSGLQITAVTKSGTNRFRGSVYDIEQQLGLEREQLGQRRRTATRSRSTSSDIYGYSIGGPVGKPGGNNKLFFFYSHEYRPPTARSTTATRSASACRPRSSAPATSRRRSTTTARLIHDTLDGLHDGGSRFADGGVRQIPANRLYAPGIALLNRYPLPNIAAGAGHELQLRGRCAVGRTR